MQYNDLADFLKTGHTALAKGPVALILVEDLIEVESTIAHHQKLGFSALLVFAPDVLELPDDLADQIHRIPYDMSADGAMENAVNAVIQAAPGIWFYYGFNAEYLFYPFCESRTVGEMTDFHMQERRASVISYVIDLYAADFATNPNAVSLPDAHLDSAGYYALTRKSDDGQTAEQQLDFYGGLRWRFEQHIPENRRKIDRVALFKGKKGLKLRADHTFNDPDYNTYECKWHHNITASIASFRVAKALKGNPGSRDDIDSFHWHNSAPFKWHSQQLLDLGMMEPGQWF